MMNMRTKEEGNDTREIKSNQKSGWWKEATGKSERGTSGDRFNNTHNTGV